MPIIIPDSAAFGNSVLSDPAIITIQAHRAMRQDARPLRVMLLNLARGKLEGDLRIARLLGNTPIQVELTLLRSDNAAEPDISAHLLQFYRSMAEVQDSWFDALVVLGPSQSGAPGEGAGDDELAHLLEWSQKRVRSHLFIGTAARDALLKLHGIRPRLMEPPLRAILPHRLATVSSPLLRGHDHVFDVPVRRSFAAFPEDLAGNADLRILAWAAASGAHLIHEPQRRQVFVLDNIAMDGDSLRREIRRTRSATDAGVPIDEPIGLSGWQAHVHLLFANWLAHDVMVVP